MQSTDWSIFRCNNIKCIQVGHDLRVANGIDIPMCAVCGELLQAPKLTEPMKSFEDDPDPEANDKVTVHMGPDVKLHECDLAEEDRAKVTFDDPGENVTEWMRCRDGIDKAEIALKGFCDSIGADVTKSRVQELCRELQSLIHTFHGLGD